MNIVAFQDVEMPFSSFLASTFWFIKSKYVKRLSYASVSIHMKYAIFCIFPGKLLIFWILLLWQSNSAANFELSASKTFGKVYSGFGVRRFVNKKLFCWVIKYSYLCVKLCEEKEYSRMTFKTRLYSKKIEAKLTVVIKSTSRKK